MKPKPIVVVGSLNLDLVVHAERIPLSGETVAGQGYDESLGGKGANQAVAAARLGNEVCMIGCLGSDAYGQRLREGMQSHGVDLSATAIVDGPSGLAVITHAQNGANSIVVIPGANGALNTAVIERHAEMIQGVAALLLQLEIPMEAVVLASRIASRAGVLVVLDPAPARDLPAELIAASTWITPNETEAAELLHMATEEMDTESIADGLLALGVRNVALKLGERGVLIKGSDCSTATMVPAFTVKAVDSTAAGDCFNAAFASRLIHGSAPAEAARYANAAAAISVTRFGAQASMPKADEVDAFLRSKEAASDAI